VRPPRPDSSLIDPAPPLWEQVAAGFVIVILTGALIGPIFAPDQGETPILRLVWLPVYAVTGALLVLRFERVVRVWPAWLALFAVLILAFVSKYWSIDPGVTVRRVIALAATGAFALYLGAAFRGPHLPRLLTWCALLMGVGSLFMVFAMPSIGVHHDVNAGLWRGLWYEKNQMGLVMVAGATAAAAWLASGSRGRIVPLMTLAISVLLILATQSKTSLVCLALGVGLIGGLWALRQGGPALAVLAVWAGVVGVVGGWWLWTEQGPALLEALGKDPSLTGRTDIWAALMRRVAERPWTGYGYGAFWGVDSVPARYVRIETQWPVPSAHNGWIDLLVQLGWPGAVLVGIIMATATLATVWRLPRAGAIEGYWGLAYLAVFGLLSLSESVLLTHQNLPWVLCLAILARAAAPEPVTARAPLAPKRRAAYQTSPRIAAQYRHGRLRSSFPVR